MSGFSHIKPKIAVLTSAGGDTLVKTGAGEIFWVAYSAGATGGAFQFVDNTTDDGDIFNVTIAASTHGYMHFDPPIRFATGLFVDIPGSNLTLNVAYN